MGLTRAVGAPPDSPAPQSPDALAASPLSRTHRLILIPSSSASPGLEEVPTEQMMHSNLGTEVSSRSVIAGLQLCTAHEKLLLGALKRGGRTAEKLGGLSRMQCTVPEQDRHLLCVHTH